MSTSDIISLLGVIATFLVVLVALFGEPIWRCIANRSKRNHVKTIITANLKQLDQDLTRIRDERNKGQGKKDDPIVFSETSFSEVSDYYFLFTEILVPNIHYMKMGKLLATIDFFNHYKMNMATIAERRGPSINGYLTRATVDLLRERLQKALKEFVGI